MEPRTAKRFNQDAGVGEAKIPDNVGDTVYQKGYLDGKLAGIKEVVEWIKNNHGDLGTVQQPVLTINGWKWGNQLKKWGIGGSRVLGFGFIHSG